MKQSVPNPIERIDNNSQALAALITAHESIDWHDVPGISVSEASAWTSRLIEAHERTPKSEENPLVCEFCGFEIEDVGQDCPALDDGECRP